MPPPKGARKPPAVRPAMPLPHVKRAAAAAAAKNKTLSQPESEVKRATSPLQRPPSANKNVADESASPAAPNDRNASAVTSKATVNGQRHLEGGAGLSPLEHEKDMSAVSPKPSTTGLDINANGHGTDRTPKPTQAAAPVEAESRQELSKIHQSKPSVSIPAGQPPRHMPPAFQPAGRPGARSPNGNGHHTHRPHPSSGSVHFGAFHDSTGTSPAPPHSGGYGPPPAIPTPDGRQGWMPPASNGFPPGMPPNIDMMAANSYEPYGRPDLAYSHLDPYGHYGSNFQPSTPHNFHESSGSAHPDDFPAMPTGPPRQGPPGFTEEPRQHAPAPQPEGRAWYPKGPWFHWVPTDGPDPPSLDEHSRQFFASGFLADCTIELRHSNARAAPFRMPAHRIYLLGSSALSEQVHEQARRIEEARQQGRQPPAGGDVIVLQADDDWVDPHAFSMALQTLYGQQLLQPPRPNGENMTAGTENERFRFALAYAASGRLLGLRPVVRRGCQMAAELLNLDTVETGLEFALDQYQDKGTHENFKWGDGTRVMLDAVLGFVFANLTNDFVFDPSALGSPYTRLPYDIPSPAQPTKEPSSPVIVRGHTPGHHRGSLSQSQHIQFGDLSLTNGPNGSPSKPISPAIQATLSRIIVNLPFSYLKPILEARFGGNHHMSGESRAHIVKDVVHERELRRERAIKAVESGQVPDADQIRASLCYVEPTYTGTWSVLGWKENVVFPAGADGPVLSRQWVPLRNESKHSAAAYP